MKPSGKLENTILAFDPSTTSTGWALMTLDGKVIIQHGQIKPSRDIAARARIPIIGRKCQQLTRLFQPRIVLIEEPDNQGIVGRTTGTQALLAACSYFIAGTIDDGPWTVVLIPVQTWKGSVPKLVIWRRLQRVYGDSLPMGTVKHPEGNDAADAVGIIHYWTCRGGAKTYSTNVGK